MYDSKPYNIAIDPRCARARFLKTEGPDHVCVPISVEAKRGGGSKPTVYIFQNVPLIRNNQLQTTVPNNSTFVYVRDIGESDQP